MAYFNPRTPCGVRPRAAGRSSSKDKQFQSTHPVRGATRAVFPARRRPHISIHAPRAGCDVVGGSCHAQGRISIHAPRAGCDFCEIFKNCQIIHFNPRTPCGVRPYLARPCILEFLFQSTHPVRGATSGSRPAVPIAADFNPRTPCGVRRQTCTTWFAPIFATLPNQMYVCLHYTCFTTLFQPKTWFSAVFQRCEAPRESMSAPASHRVKASAAPPAHRSAWRRYAQRGSDSYSQDCKSAGCPSPG